VLKFVIAGLVLGGIYAIAASGLVVTYLAAGILNFSFGAIAYAVARFYYYLNTQEHWSILPAALLALVGLGPVLGAVLYLALFRLLRMSSTLVKIVATLGLSVAIPPLCTVIFGSEGISIAPGLAPEPVHVFRVLGVPVTLDQVIVYSCVAGVAIIGTLVMLYTDVGLRVRAMVDSAAMTSLSGTNPSTVSLGVWAVSTGLAGLVGVLAAPIIGLDPTDFTLLILAAFTAVIAARFRSIPIAVGVAFGIGIAGSLFQGALPPGSDIVAVVVPSIPFIVTVLFLIYFAFRRELADESLGVGGALDRAIKPQGEGASLRNPRGQGTAIGQGGNKSTTTALGWRPPAVGFAAVCVLPLILHSFWVGLVGQGVAYAIIFLSFTLVTGEGGMIWLCQATFAAIGGMSAALIVTDLGWPVIAAVVCGGIIAVPFGLLIGLLTIRFGDLYVALVTLTFGLLMENLVFSHEIFSNNGSGLTISPPHFAAGARAFDWFALGVFAILSLVVANLHRSTTGLALSAIRSSSRGASTLGISKLKMKLMVAGLAAFVAGIGGAMVALALGVSLASNYSTLIGIVWLAILVTLGIRSNVAALFAGLSNTLLAGVALAYLPQIFSNFTPIFFGMGAVFVAKFPDGTLAMQARQARNVGARFRGLSAKRRSLIGRTIGGLLVIMIAMIAAFPREWWISFLSFWVFLHIVVGYLLIHREPVAVGASQPEEATKQIVSAVSSGR
jgi:branched-chain amino acid transport system permease protein